MKGGIKQSSIPHHFLTKFQVRSGIPISLFLKRRVILLLIQRKSSSPGHVVLLFAVRAS